MATRGAMPKYEQLEYKKNPYNIINGYSKGKLIINSGTIPFLLIAHNTIFPSENIITVNGESLLGINISDDGFIGLSLKLYDENDNLVMEIIDNEWISGDFLAWDIEVSYKWIKIRPKKRKIILDIKIDGIIKIKADLWRRRSNIKLSPEKLEIIGNDGNIKFSTDHFRGYY